MVSRFLITTAELSTWKKSEPIVFLGDWCKLYSQRDIWTDLDSKTEEYHWNNRERLYSDYQYLQNLYTKTLVSISHSLNKYHKVNRSIRYWKIFIGPWLFHFIHIIFDRWKMIENVTNNNSINGTTVLSGLEELVTPLNFKEFSELYSGELWNHWVYGEIIKYADKIPVEEIEYKENKQEKTDTRSQSKVKQISRLILKLYAFFTRNSKVFFFGGGGGKLGQIKLEILLGQLPTFYSLILNKEICIKKNNRDMFNIDFIEDNQFESFLLKMIPTQIPKYYLEGYKQLCKECHNINLPVNPKIIVSSSAIITTDIFKFWVSEKVERGAKLIVSQHGGHYGIGKWNSSEDHEVSIANAFLSWGWSGKNVQPLSSFKLSNVKNKRTTIRKKYVLMALGLTPRYSYWLYSVPMSSQWGEYLDDQVQFIELLPKYIRDALKIRLSLGDYNWNQRDRLLDRFPAIKFDDSKNTFESSVNNSKVFIGTYNATTFLETLSKDIPTIIYWNPLYSEIRDSAKQYIDLLHSAGILHYTPESIASHLQNIWPDIDYWWSQDEVQSARRIFINNYARTSSTYILEWSDFLKKRMATH
jgi:putative transferase (TIGR04331 family)